MAKSVTKRDLELAGLLRHPLLRLVRMIRAPRVDLSVTVAELSVLNRLAKFGPMSIGELAAREAVRPPTMTNIVLRLERRGLVARERRPVDKRQSFIVLTLKAHDLLESESSQRDAWLAQRLSRLTTEQRKAIWNAVPVLEELARQEDEL